MLLTAALAAAVACYGTISGLGGGILFVPVLLLAGYGMQVATPMSLAAVFLASVAGMLPAPRRALVDVEIFRTVAVAAVLGSLLGGALAQHLPEEPLLLLFAGVSAVVTVDSLRPDRGRRAGHLGGARRARLAAGGGAAGLLSGSLGIGGGVLIVPLVRHLGPLRIERATATSIAVIVFSSSVGVASNLLAAPAAGLSGVPLELLLAAGLGAISGGWVGGRFSPRVGERARAALVSFGAAAATIVALVRLAA